MAGIYHWTDLKSLVDAVNLVIQQDICHKTGPLTPPTRPVIFRSNGSGYSGWKDVRTAMDAFAQANNTVAPCGPLTWNHPVNLHDAVWRQETVDEIFKNLGILSNCVCSHDCNSLSFKYTFPYSSGNPNLFLCGMTFAPPGCWGGAVNLYIYTTGHEMSQVATWSSYNGVSFGEANISATAKLNCDGTIGLINNFVTNSILGLQSTDGWGILPVGANPGDFYRGTWDSVSVIQGNLVVQSQGGYFGDLSRSCSDQGAPSDSPCPGPTV